MSRCFLARFVLVLLQALDAGTGLPPRSPPPAPSPRTPASLAHTPHTSPHLVYRHTAHFCNVECQLAEGSIRSLQMSCRNVSLLLS